LLEESTNGGRFAFLSISQGMALLQGGVPDRNRRASHWRNWGFRVKASDDEAIALAGANALKGQLR
jgi:hypothetical protein